jgi:hypothetical protein
MNKPNSAGQYKCLVKHFFRRFFDLEAVTSPQVDSIEKNVLTFQILALIILPGVLKSLFLGAKYAYYMYRPAVERDAATLTDKCFFLSLSMIILGFITVYEWDMLFPDQKDYLILTPFPVATRIVFFSKVAALAAFLLVFTVAVDICPTVLFPNVVLADNSFAYKVLGRRTPISLILRYISSHGISILLGNIFICLSAISFQGILLVLIPPKIAPAISRCIRFICLLMLFGTLLLFPGISSVDQLIHSASLVATYYAPIWFVGIYEVLLGSHDPAMWSLAERAGIALAIATVLSVLAYAMCYRRFMRKSVESGSGVSSSSVAVRNMVNRVLDRWFLRYAENRASFHFAGQTIFRSPRHVLYIGTFFVIGSALAGIELTTAMFGSRQSDAAILSIPLILSFFLLVGMRVCFAIPVDLDSNWLFRLAPIQQLKESHAGIRKLLIGMIIIPIFLVVGLFCVLVWDWEIVLLHVCYGITLSLILMELLFTQFPKVPFTCSYLPGAAKTVLFWPLYILAFKCYGYATAYLEAWLLGDISRFFYFYILAAVLLVILVRHNIKSAGATIRFEEMSEEAPTYLDLRS